MKNPFILAALGIGVVFVILAINYFLIHLIGLFRDERDEDTDSTVSECESGISSESESADGLKSTEIHPVKADKGEFILSIHKTEHELIVAAMSAIYAYEMEGVRGDSKT